MHITFGMFMDGAAWSPKTASLNEITCGPHGLLSFLEGHLGLDGVHATQAERIQEYLQKISTVNPPWSKRSFVCDAWSTTILLLAWRDELVMAGWDGKGGTSERLKALASIEACDSPLSPGEGDRLKSVLAALDGNIAFHNMEIELCTPQEHLPFLWRKIIEKLQSRGMAIQNSPSTCDIKAKCLCVKASDEMTLAKVFARYLSAGDNSDVAVIADGDTHLLDGVLHEFGFGAINHTEPSRWRNSLQILPLWLETLWKPFNPRTFLELLRLPVSPIRPMVAKALADVMRQTPGIGSDEWNEAWNRIDEYITKNEHGHYNDPDAEILKIHDLRRFLEEDCFKADDIVLGKEIIKRCDLMIERLGVKVKDQPNIGIAISHAKTVKTLIDSSQEYSRIMLSRMVETVIGTGTTGDGQAEVNVFTVYAHPGAVNQPFKTILWWNFTDKGNTSNTYWTKEEKEAVPGLDQRTTERNTHAWKRGISFASEHVIAFCPENVAGEPAFVHPLADEIDFGQPLPSSSLVDDDGEWQLADRTLQLQETSRTIKPTNIQISSNSIAPRRALSYSQMSKLLTCPFRWFMDDYVGLRQTSILDMPSHPQMIGTLAHKVVELLYKGNERLETDEASRRAGELFDELVPQMAAELLQNGKSIELKRIRDTLCTAITSLVTEINKRGLKVKGLEKEIHGLFRGIDFTGKIDMYLEDDAGNPFVIDMKWSSN
ncbi:MAG: PD-(D/E)XK nuclease family protein, partial [Victivallales bacterium]|nr:PD-(D/E)XK nuclease family protein [Victivallales bacterium]